MIAQNRRASLISRWLLAVALSVSLGSMDPPQLQDAQVLVFSKTMGWRHDSIPAGKNALVRLAREHSFSADTTEDATVFNDETLRAYNAVVFLNTTLDVLNSRQQVALMRYIQAGGGFVGIHSAADTEYEWPWYGRLVGGYFDGHPNNPGVREAVITVRDATHASTMHLPTEWIRRDEWYDYRDPNPDVNVLLTLDESSYKRPSEKPKSDRHAIAWYHEFDGGRSFYTGLGHTKESFSEPMFLEHLLGGIRYAVGDRSELNYDHPGVVPRPQQFRKVILEENLNEPMELDLLPDGRVLYVERPGAVRIYDHSTGTTASAGSLAVTTQAEDGLLGVAIDPDYQDNKWIYLLYSPVDGPARQHLSRFRLADGQVDLGSETIMLRIPLTREGERAGCCHSGGSLEFGADGNLFVSVGDNTNPFASDGAAPIDERPGRTAFDAQKSASNAADLRGKILRIRPEPDGTYSIPDGNLFPKDGTAGRPEIYIMGNRNPFRISIDAKTGHLYWGEVGPDAPRDSTTGPMGYDEINRASKAGNFGWPYAIANNQPYRDRDFATGEQRDLFDCVNPINDSPNNTGPRHLPPCRPAWIWYPYDASSEFPLVGAGGRTAMAGPVYRPGDSNSPSALPPYYGGKLFVYEWMRGWIKTVRLDNHRIPLMESFMPETEFSRPMDMVIGKDGVMYLLEYGNEWNTRNPDARLARIVFDSEYSEPDTDLPTASQNIAANPGHATAANDTQTSPTATGERLVKESDCSACHAINKASVGPSFVAIADRYRGQSGAVDLLAGKVRMGGSGVWGQQPMIPHPQHTADEIEAMVKYILSLEADED